MLVFSFILGALPLFLLFKTHLKRTSTHSRRHFSFSLPLRSQAPFVFIQREYASPAIKI